MRLNSSMALMSCLQTILPRDRGHVYRLLVLHFKAIADSSSPETPSNIAATITLSANVAFLPLQPMPSPFTRQPYKAIWTTWTILYCLVRIPIIALYYIPKASRPHQSWTHRQALGRELLDLWFAYASTVEFRLSLHLDPGSEKEDFVNIRPAARRIYPTTFSEAVEPSVQPEVIGGTWLLRAHIEERSIVFFPRYVVQTEGTGMMNPKYQTSTVP